MSTLFDPSTGKLVDPDGLRSVQINAGGFTRPQVTVDPSTDTKTVQDLDDNTGRDTGFHRYHGDGRVDATAALETVSMSANELKE